MNKPVRVGILMFEHYHANFWAKAFQQNDDAVLVGFWEPDETRAASAIQTH